jgi:hypothetical protein
VRVKLPLLARDFAGALSSLFEGSQRICGRHLKICLIIAARAAAVGACTGRWQPAGENKSAFRDIVKQGPVPGLIAFDGKLADVRIGYRRKGVTSILIEAALKEAKRSAARPIMRYDL